MEETRNNWPYNEYDDLVCSVCRKQAKSSDSELLEGTVLEVLEVVLVNLNLTTIKPVICKECNEKLLDVFQHKSKWIYTEDRLFPYVNSASDGKVDIKTVYRNENDCKIFDIDTDTRICRLCMELINDNSWNMLVDVLEQQYSVEIFEKYVPELNLSATENPIICKGCLDSLSVFMGFVTFCQRQEMKTEDYFEVEDESKPGGINSEILEDLKQNNMGYREITKYTKYPHVSKNKTHLLKHALINKGKKQAKLCSCKICSDRSTFKVNFENHLLTHPTKNLKCVTCDFRSTNKFDLNKPEMRHKSDLIDQQHVETEMFRCTLCSYKAKRQGHLQSHLLIHKRLSQVEVVKCELCSYKTKYKRNLRPHILGHNLPSNVKMKVKVFKCEFCCFETKHKRSIQQHILTHKSLSEVEVFKCELCTFKTKYKRSLKHHTLIHKPRSEVELFKCEFCSYKAKRKADLPSHMLTHKRLSELEVFKCEFCTFETKLKKYLENHILIHKSLSEVEVFKCEFCSFETKRKRSLQQHILTHKSLSEVEVFNCEFCTFKTKYKRSLQHHTLIHKPLSEVELFKCEFCSYEAKRKGDLPSHILTHKSLSEVEVFKCEFCSYVTKYKSCLRKHHLIHKSFSKVKVFKCEFCHFKTKYKHSLLGHIHIHKSSLNV